MKISVVTAVYNGAEFISDAVDSILRQTRSCLDYIIVNDGSTDDTSQILDQITDPRVKIIQHEENQGAAKSLRNAIEQAGGDFIAIQDADDVSLPERLQRQASFLEKNPEVALAGSYIQCFYQQHELKRRARATERLINTARPQSFYGSDYCHGTFMFTKDMYQKIGGYSENYLIAYDYDLLQRFQLASKVHKIPEVLYRYRLHPTSLSNQDLMKTNHESMEISVRGIVEFTGDKNFLIIGTDAARQFFKQKIAAQIRGVNFHYAAPIVADGLEKYLIIILDFRGSEKFTKELSYRGIDFFKVWCVIR